MKKINMLLSFVFLMVICPISVSNAATGRELLFNHGNPTYSGLVAANQKFKDALSAEPNNQEANLFYAVTRIGTFTLEEGSGSGLETLRDVFQAFGMTRNSNEFFEDGSPYDTPSKLPGNSPSGEEIRQFLVGPCVTLLNGALDNLKEIDSSFQTTLTADETGGEAVEIDYGDILMYKAMLNASKCLLLIMSSYNINVDINEVANKINNDPFSINADLLNTYPNLLKLVNGGGETLLSAEAALLAAINRYLYASTFIRTIETDDQLNDLIAFDPDDLQDEELFRQNLNELKASLNENKTADLTDNVEHLLLNLNFFFGYESDPYDLRDFLPLFNQCSNPIAGTVGHGLGDDATLGGILPGYLQADWGIESEPGAIMYVNKDDWICGGKEPCRQSITQAIVDAGCEVLIKVASGIYNEDIVLTDLKFITLQGGYDSPYESQTGATTANSMIIKEGTMTVSNIVLGPAGPR